MHLLHLREFFIIKIWKTTTGKNIGESQGGGLPVSMTYNVPWSESESHSVMSDSLGPHGLYSPWNSPGQNTGVGSLSLLQGIFPTQELNPGLPYCRQILYQLSHKGSPRIQEWVAYTFSSGSSRSRNWTGVSCIAGRFFTNWAIREAERQYVVTPKGYAPKPQFKSINFSVLSFLHSPTLTSIHDYWKNHRFD